MNIANNLNDLDKLTSKITTLGQDLFQSYQYTFYFDYYCNCQLNRTFNIVKGFIQLANSDNFISALSLVRINLDTLLRLYGFQLIDKNVDEIVKEIWEGKEFNTYRNKFTNEKLSDSHLSREISKIENFEWVRYAYLTGNEFVHFTNKHIAMSTKIDFEDKTIKSIISPDSEYIPIEEKIGSWKCMFKITAGILYHIQSWVRAKKRIF